MTAEELLQRYAAGERDFRGVDLSGAELMEVNLEGINLQGAILKGAVFSWSRLDRSIFSNADLEGSEFWESSLRDTDFRCANLRNSLIRDANLIRANFEGAVIESCDLGGYTYQTIMPNGQIDTCVDPGKDRAIAQGKSKRRVGSAHNHHP